ncbi:unnamed protein product, partial [Closterium sp. Naga37s-1]
QWQPHEVEMVEAVADQVAIALSHAAALEESQRRREEMAEQNAALQVARIRAEEAIQARNDFLSVMNHEMRSPLHTILALSSLMEGPHIRLPVTGEPISGNEARDGELYAHPSSSP